MNELYYFPSIKMNAKISEIVEDGFPIEMEGYKYERLLRKPRGRSILRRLVNENTQTRLIIYK
jgi:hypothetical protein|tara:strand:+ start:722 stop:910 length:189 start_codon:yes stop_codon:yes gene_type:complete